MNTDTCNSPIQSPEKTSSCTESKRPKKLPSQELVLGVMFALKTSPARQRFFQVLRNKGFAVASKCGWSTDRPRLEAACEALTCSEDVLESVHSLTAKKERSQVRAIRPCLESLVWP